jgi:hypothetical protein
VSHHLVQVKFFLKTLFIETTSFQNTKISFS